jgi:hypothetical protein
VYTAYNAVCTLHELATGEASLQCCGSVIVTAVDGSERAALVQAVIAVAVLVGYRK